MKRSDLAAYEGREQAYVKHALLAAYLERFIMILGQHFPRIVYVDCFAGPWRSSSDDFEDTSFGQALQIMRACKAKLQEDFNKNPQFEALFIEKNPDSYERLNEYVVQASSPGLKVTAWQGEFQSYVTKIADLIGSDFAFVLIDPKGWKTVIEPDVLAPLLKKRSVEVLINYMWNFLSMAVGHLHVPAQEQNLVRLYGKEVRNAPGSGQPNREAWLLNLYRKGLVDASVSSGANRTRTISFPIEYPGRVAVKYFLIHATHHDLGVIKFAEASEDSLGTQNAVRFCVNQQKREGKTLTQDLFANVEVDVVVGGRALTQPWLEILPVAGSEMRIGEAEMAVLIERNNCFLGELQKGLADLIERGVLVNLDAKRARPKNAVIFKNRERLKRLL